jgi:hypothetical protein
MESKVAINTRNHLVLSVSLLNNQVAIKQMLQQHLKTAIVFSEMDIVELTSEKISLHRLSDQLGIFYRCALAFKLASFWKIPAFDIAHHLMQSVTKINVDNSHREWENVSSVTKINVKNSPLTCFNFQVELVSPGWINLRLSHQGLATWLEHLHQIPSQRHVKRSLSCQYSQNLFPVQYAHARCCSLLRSAHQQSLIQLKNCDSQTHPWQFLEPRPIPWLNEDQTRLQLLHPAEQLLLEQILDISDSLESTSQVNCVKLALGLSQAFEQFERSCRIWGEVKSQTQELAQARLGLVALTQALLQSLLQDQLASFAPIEL